MAKHSPRPSIAWRCDHCGHEIKDGLGYIAVDVDHANRVRMHRLEERRRLEAERIPGSLVIGIPRIVPPARWYATHRRCDPDIDRGDYWIGVEHLRTTWGILSRNEHLAGKVWITSTDWFSFIRSRVDPSSPTSRVRITRASIAPRRRFDILQRDGFRCKLCGRSAEEHGVTLEVDHQQPLAKGGADDDSNLWTLCRDCNAGKSDRC